MLASWGLNHAYRTFEAEAEATAWLEGMKNEVKS